jgi:hypothetical protein
MAREERLAAAAALQLRVAVYRVSVEILEKSGVSLGAVDPCPSQAARARAEATTPAAVAGRKRMATPV